MVRNFQFHLQRNYRMRVQISEIREPWMRLKSLQPIDLLRNHHGSRDKKEGELLFPKIIQHPIEFNSIMISPF